MKLGVAVPSFASDTHKVPANRIKSFARRAENLGFAGAWVIEHIIPAPTYATSFLDPLTTLATVAGATERLPIGTSILILPMRNPVLVAKRAASIQHLSEGRLTLGLGQGYLKQEYDAVNEPFDERGPMYREELELLRRLFNEDKVSYDGDFYDVEDFRLEPKNPRPPRMLVAGVGVERDGRRFVPRAVKRRVLNADGWIFAPTPPDLLAQDWADIADYIDEKGRDPRRIDRVELNYLHLVPGVDRDVALEKQRKVLGEFFGPERDIEEVEDNYLTGTVEEIQEKIARYAELGIDEVILGPATNDPAELHRQLELWDKHLLSEF